MCVGWGELSLCGSRVCSMVCVLPLRSGHFLIRISSWPLDGWHCPLDEVFSVMS